MTVPFLYKVIGFRFSGFFNGLFGGEFEESSAISRNIMLETALKLVQNNPLFGYGLNTFQTFQGSFGTWSHNNYLEILVSGGILPLLIYYSFFFITFIRARKHKKIILCRLIMVLVLLFIFFDFLSITYISRFVGLNLCILDRLTNLNYYRVVKRSHVYNHCLEGTN